MINGCRVEPSCAVVDKTINRQLTFLHQVIVFRPFLFKGKLFVDLSFLWVLKKLSRSESVQSKRLISQGD